MRVLRVCLFAALLLAALCGLAQAHAHQAQILTHSAANSYTFTQHENLVDFPNQLSQGAIEFLSRDFSTMSAEEVELFSLAAQLGSAVNQQIEEHYQETIAFPSHSFLSISSSDMESFVAQELSEWEQEAHFQHRSFSEIAAAHHDAIEHEFMHEHDTEAEMEMEVEMEVEWPKWAKKLGGGLKRMGKAAMKGAVKLTAGAAKVANKIGGALDGIENKLKQGAHWVTKKTGTQFLNKYIDAGISFGMNAIPGVGQFRAIQTGLNTAAAVTKGLQQGGWKGALKAGKGALVDAAKSYVMNKIPGAKVLGHAMSGPLGKMASKLGGAVMNSPLAKKAMAASQKVLSSKLMKSPLGQKLLEKVKQKGSSFVQDMKDKGLNWANDKIQEKTGIDLNLAGGGWGGKGGKGGKGFKGGFKGLAGKAKDLKAGGMKGLAAKAKRAWDPSKHPRDAKGRFTKLKNLAKDVSGKIPKDLKDAAKQAGKDALNAAKESALNSADFGDASGGGAPPAPDTTVETAQPGEPAPADPLPPTAGTSPLAKAPTVSAPPAGALAHALRGPLGDMVKAQGPAAIASPEGQQLVNSAGQALESAVTGGRRGKFLKWVSEKYGDEAQKAFAEKLMKRASDKGLDDLRRVKLKTSFERLAAKNGYKQMSEHDLAAQRIREAVKKSKEFVKDRLRRELREKLEKEESAQAASETEQTVTQAEEAVGLDESEALA